MQNQLGKLYVVATPIGNLQDLSDRTREILSQVTWIAAEDTRHSRVLLNYLGITTTLIPYHEHNERETFEQLIRRLKKGEEGAIISDAGTPLISDPGYLLVKAAHEAQIQVIPVPGPSSILAALCVSGLPTSRFLFEGFLSAKSGPRQKRFTELAHFPDTMVFMEAPHRVLAFFQDASSVLGEERFVCIARELTKKYESVMLSDIKTVLKRLESGDIPQMGEFVIVVAGVPPAKQLSEQQRLLQKLLPQLLTEMPLKQAVQVAKICTDLPKGEIYDSALLIKKEM